MLLLGAAHATASAAPSGTGSGPIWVAAIGAASLIVGALIPELFKLLRPALPDGQATSGAEVRALTERVQALATQQGSLAGRLGAVQREQRVLRDVMESRDRDHLRELEGVRDMVQRHLWGDHGQARGPSSGEQPIPVPRGG